MELREYATILIRNLALIILSVKMLQRDSDGIRTIKNAPHANVLEHE